MPLTDNEITQIAEAVSSNIRAGHTCKFNETESEIVHGFGRAIKAHEAGEQEIFIVIQLGKHLTTIGKRIGNAILWALIIGAAAFLISGMVPVQWRFWK